jgi:hypothetical protein
MPIASITSRMVFVLAGIIGDIWRECCPNFITCFLNLLPQEKVELKCGKFLRGSDLCYLVQCAEKCIAGLRFNFTFEPELPCFIFCCLKLGNVAIWKKSNPADQHCIICLTVLAAEQAENCSWCSNCISYTTGVEENMIRCPLVKESAHLLNMVTAIDQGKPYGIHMTEV